MKRTLSILVIFLSFISKSQNKVGYHYDNNGNRDQRFFIGLRSSNNNPPSPADSVLNIIGRDTSSTSTPKTNEPQTIAMDKGITVYPNPTKDLVNVTITKAGIKENKNATMFLVDNNGRILDTKNYSGTDLSFDLGKNPPGTYYLKIVFEDKETLTYNIVKVN